MLVTRSGELPSSPNTAGMRARRTLRFSVLSNAFFVSYIDMTSMEGRNTSSDSSLACDLFLNYCMQKHVDAGGIGLWEVLT